MKEEKRYWNPIIETLPREKLQEIPYKRWHRSGSLYVKDILQRAKFLNKYSS